MAGSDLQYFLPAKVVAEVEKLLPKTTGLDLYVAVPGLEDLNSKLQASLSERDRVYKRMRATVVLGIGAVGGPLIFWLTGSGWGWAALAGVWGLTELLDRVAISRVHARIKAIQREMESLIKAAWQGNLWILIEAEFERRQAEKLHHDARAAVSELERALEFAGEAEEHETQPLYEEAAKQLALRAEEVALAEEIEAEATQIRDQQGVAIRLAVSMGSEDAEAPMADVLERLVHLRERLEGLGRERAAIREIEGLTVEPG